LLKELKRAPLWFVGCRLLIYFLGEGGTFDTISYWYYIGLIVAVVMQRLVGAVVFASKVKRVENLWSRRSIQKLKPLTDGMFQWRNVKVFDLMVGDVIRLTEGTVSPADLLVLDTSQSRHSEKILYTNESKITGKSRTIIKTAVKNVSDFRLSQSKSLGEEERLSEFMQRLTGYIEYDPPSSQKISLKGTIKLKSDPKMTVFDSINVVLAGSKLYSEWMIGLVLFNGRNTKIMMKTLEFTERQTIFSKKSGVIQRAINILTLWLFIGAIWGGAVLYFMMQIETGNKVILELVEGFTFGNHIVIQGYSGLKKFASLLLITSLDMPLHIFFMLDLVNFIRLLLSERSDESLKRVRVDKRHPSITITSPKRRGGPLIQDSTMIPGTDPFNSKPKRKWCMCLKSKKSMASDRTDTHHDSTVLLTVPGGTNFPNLAAAHNAQRFVRDSKRDGSLFKTLHLEDRSPLNRQSSRRGSPGMISSQTDREVERTGMSDTDIGIKGLDTTKIKQERVQALSLDALGLLGGIDQIIFDKTEVLTTGSLYLKQLATCAKNYSFNDTEFVTNMTDFRGNPEFYNMEDSLEEDNHEEDPSYEEKTHECEAELYNEYDQAFFSSEDSLEERMNNLKYPTYLSDNAMENANREAESPPPVNSIIEETSHYFHALKQAVHSINHEPHFPLPAVSSLNSIPQLHLFKNTSNNSQGSKKEIGLHVGKSNQKLDGKSPRARDIIPIQPAFDIAYDPKNGSVKVKTPSPSKIDDKFNLGFKNIGRSSGVDDLQNTHNSISSLDQSALNNDTEQEPIRINFTRDHNTKHFISDLANRKNSLDDFINYLYLFQEVGSLIEHQKKKKLVGHTQTKTALSLIFGEFGYMFSTSGRKDTTDAAAMVQQDIKSKKLAYGAKIISQFGVVTNFIVKLVNDYTNNRKRMSIIICDTEQGRSINYLLVNGDEKYMRPCLRLTKRNKNQYKMLVSKYKSEGYKQIVIGKKVLSAEEVDNYMSSFVAILKTSRDQLQALEKLASSMETDLSFVGMIGVIDEIRPEAKNLCDAVRETGIGMNVFSGDTLERCLHVVKKLKISKADFRKSADFFHLNFRTEARANIEMKRMFDAIYDILKKTDIDEKNKVRIEFENQQAANLEKFQDMGIKKKSGFFGVQKKLDFSLFKSLLTKNADKPEKIKKKTLLISGPAIGVLMKSKHLRNCFMAGLYLSDCIIMHSAQPSHCMFLVEALRKRDQSTILTIGDGFNYIGVMKRADVSVQVLHPDVPLVFGDFVVSDLKDLSRLIFVDAFNAFKISLTIFLHEVWRLMPYSFLIGAFAVTSMYSGLLVSQFHVLSFYCQGILQLIFTAFVNKPYPDALLQKLNVLYCENKYAEHYTIRMLIYIFAHSVLEATYQATLLVLLVGTNMSPTGVVIAHKEIQDIVYIAMVLLCAIKHVLLSLGREFKAIMFNIGVLCLMGIACWIRYIYSDEDIFDEGMLYIRIFTQKNLLIYLVFLVLPPAYFAYCLNLYFKATFLTPFSKVVRPEKTVYNSGIRTVVVSNNINDFLSRAKEIKEYIFSSLYDFPIEYYIGKIKSRFPANSDFGPIQKISFIDSFNNRMGISNLTNKIADGGEAKRYIIDQMRRERKEFRHLLIFYLGSLIVEYVLTMLSTNATNYLLDSTLLYMFVVTLFPLAISYIKRQSFLLYKCVTATMIIEALVIVILTFFRGKYSDGGARFSYSRLTFTSLPIDFVPAALLGIVTDVMSYIK
jgi:magnesium-transporting ATPase (P-type)